jgi:hypothetical protein
MAAEAQSFAVLCIKDLPAAKEQAAAEGHKVFERKRRQTFARIASHAPLENIEWYYEQCGEITVDELSHALWCLCAQKDDRVEVCEFLARHGAVSHPHIVFFIKNVEMARWARAHLGDRFNIGMEDMTFLTPLTHAIEYKNYPLASFYISCILETGSLTGTTAPADASSAGECSLCEHSHDTDSIYNDNDKKSIIAEAAGQEEFIAFFEQLFMPTLGPKSAAKK